MVGIGIKRGALLIIVGRDLQMANCSSVDRVAGMPQRIIAISVPLPALRITEPDSLETRRRAFERAPRWCSLC
jgi:hypothetical protein